MQAIKSFVLQCDNFKLDKLKLLAIDYGKGLIGSLSRNRKLVNSVIGLPL